MSDIESRVRDIVLDKLRDRLVLIGVPESDITDAFDIVGSGIIDSVGFLELIVTLEEEFGFEVELARIRIEEATTVSGLAGMVRSFVTR